MDESTMARLLDEKLEHYPTKQDVAWLLDRKLESYPTKQYLHENFPTKQYLLENFPTKQYLHENFPTKAEMRAGFEDMRHFFRVTAEGLRDDIRMVADQVMAINERLDRTIQDNERRFGAEERRIDGLDVRLSRLEEHAGRDDARDR